jgi:hypothetical protein
MGGDAVTVLTEARAVGLEVRTEPGRLVVRGPRSLETLAYRILERKAEVTTLLAAEDAEVEWRAKAMRPQMPRTGPIPLLVARDVRPAPEQCVSCGEPIGLTFSRRCQLCGRAARQVIGEVREGIAPG